jgi:NifB/MoaA-like Fe-S oxidoreductase
VFLGDEVYLQAGLPVPPSHAYEGFTIAEDGIGLVRRFEDDFGAMLRRLRPAVLEKSLTIVSGALYAPRLAALVARLPFEGLAARVVAVPNRFFGGTISVTGLLTGEDIQRELSARAALGDAVLVPAVCLRDGDGVFLDDVTPADLARDLGVRVSVVEPTPRALVQALRS